MSKRFTDSRKWDDPFFIDLNNEYKLLWLFILDKCNHAGIFKISNRLIEFSLGIKINIDDIKNTFKDRIHFVNEEKWFIPKFLDFQYGELNIDNRVHNSIIQILKNEGLYKGRSHPFQGCKDKDYDKDKDYKINNDTDHDKEQNTGSRFNEFWSLYPKPLGQSMAFITFRATVKTDKDFEDLKTALSNYRESKEYKDGYIKNGDRWIEDWRGWLALAPKKQSSISKYEVKNVKC